MANRYRKRLAQQFAPQPDRDAPAAQRPNTIMNQVIPNSTPGYGPTGTMGNQPKAPVSYDWQKAFAPSAAMTAYHQPTPQQQATQAQQTAQATPQPGPPTGAAAQQAQARQGVPDYTGEEQFTQTRDALMKQLSQLRETEVSPERIALEQKLLDQARANADQHSQFLAAANQRAGLNVGAWDPNYVPGTASATSSPYAHYAAIGGDGQPYNPYIENPYAPPLGWNGEGIQQPNWNQAPAGNGQGGAGSAAGGAAGGGATGGGAAPGGTGAGTGAGGGGGGAASGLRLSPEAEAVRRSLEDELSGTLAGLNVQREQIGPMMNAILTRLVENQNEDLRVTDENANERGLFHSGIRTRDRSRVTGGYDRQRQDLASSVAQQYAGLANQESGARSNFQKQWANALLGIAQNMANDPNAAVSAPSGGGGSGGGGNSGGGGGAPQGTVVTGGLTGSVPFAASPWEQQLLGIPNRYRKRR